MKTLLLCGYTADDHHSEVPGLKFIDTQITALTALGFEVVCVLSGAGADDLLRTSKRIAGCELAFDTSASPNLASNLKAGLAATDGEGCFVLPVEVPCPPSPVWEALREEWRTQGFHTGYSCLQAVQRQGAPCHFGFPLLVTRSGSAQISQMQAFRSLVDTRLKYLHVVHQLEPKLASTADRR